MSARDDHLSESLGAYVLGALDAQETRQIAAHLVGCAECRALATELTGLKDSLGAVPPEIFLDGLPEGGDLALRRALRQVRAEHRAGLRTRTVLMSAGAVIAVAVVLGGGVVLGRNTAPTDAVALPSPTTAAGRAPSIRAAMHIHGASNGAELSVTVMPAGGWVRVAAWVAGVPTGQKCQLVVVSRSGRTEVAGSWLVSRHGTTIGTNLEGAALIPADQVASVQVRNFEGYTFVSASG